MLNIRKTILGLVAFSLVLTAAMTSQAAVKKAKNPVPPAPVVIEADELYLSDLTGELFAKGNVSVTQNDAQMLTDIIRGNEKQKEVWVDGNATFLQPGTRLVGLDTHYNYGTRTGIMQNVSGKVDKELVFGKNIEILPSSYVMNDATVTRCPAKVPDYHVSATKVEIWPGEKMIAYDAKFWIKNKVIYSMPKYQKSLRKGESGTDFPRVAYYSGDGIMIAQYLEYPVVNNLALFSDLAYYSGRGFRPSYGLVDREKNYVMKLSYANERNADGEWVKKEPEFSLKFAPRRLGSTPWTANLAFSAGRWSEGTVSGSRQDYIFYLNNDSIKLSDKVKLYLGTGYERVYYGYNRSSNGIWYSSAKLVANPNDRFEVWGGYSYSRQSGTTPYIFDKIDVARELAGGFMYKVDPKDAIGINMSYDAGTNKIKDVDYVWRRNLHCWEADITYRAKRNQVTMKLATINL